VSVIPDGQRLSRRHALHALQSGVLAGGLLGIAPMRVLADDDQPAAVVGSWLIRSGPVDKLLPITSLITYIAQGTCIQTTVSHPMRSPAMGVWTHLGEREFAITFQAFAFDPNGHFTNVSQVRVQSVLDDGLDSYEPVSATRTQPAAHPHVRIPEYSPVPCSCAQAAPGAIRPSSRCARSATAGLARGLVAPAHFARAAWSLYWSYRYWSARCC
jgi:hypothetical protein